MEDRLAMGASFWRRADVDDERRWVHAFGDQEREALAKTVQSLRGRDLSSLTLADLPAEGALVDAARRWREALRSGLGFVLIRGLLVELPAEDLELGFVVLGLHLGTLVSQNLKGELLTHCATPAPIRTCRPRGSTRRAPSRTSTPTART